MPPPAFGFAYGTDSQLWQMLLVQQYAHQMGQAVMCYLHTKYRTFKQIDALGKPEERRTVLVARQQSTGLSTVFFYVTSVYVYLMDTLSSSWQRCSCSV